MPTHTVRLSLIWWRVMHWDFDPKQSKLLIGVWSIGWYLFSNSDSNWPCHRTIGLNKRFQRVDDTKSMYVVVHLSFKHHVAAFFSPFLWKKHISKRFWLMPKCSHSLEVTGVNQHFSSDTSSVKLFTMSSLCCIPGGIHCKYILIFLF